MKVKWLVRIVSLFSQSGAIKKNEINSYTFGLELLQKIITMTSFQGLKGLFGSKKSASHNNRHIAEIGAPTNVVHDIHVGKNAHGELEGNYLIQSYHIYTYIETPAYFCVLFYLHATQMLFLIDQKKKKNMVNYNIIFVFCSIEKVCQRLGYE